MDFILYFLILVIVIATGYVLSKPLIKPPDGQETIDVEVNQGKYERVLGDIKVIESAYQAGEITKEVCQTQISEKKRQAADLLRTINPRLDIVIREEELVYAIDDDDVQPSSELTAQEAEICPQCGHKVETGDKFCMHCGHRLRP
jgi:hypothetical protein